MLLVQMMDYLLDLLEQDPHYASYTLDSHTIIVEDYLEIRPENRERLERLVRDKRIFVGPWYTLPDIPNTGAESVVRNLMFGHRIGSALGHTMKVGYTPCSWGQTGQLPQIYAGFGIDTALFYRGISPHECSSEFLWESPDGTCALAHRFALFARYNYYYLVFRKITYGLDIYDRRWEWDTQTETAYKAAGSSADYASLELLEPDVLYQKERLKDALNSMLDMESGQYAGPIFLAMHGHDISWPHPLEPTVVRDSQNLLPGITVKHSDLEQYFVALRHNLDIASLKVLKGERRTNLKEGFWTYLLPGTISARTRLKQENTRTENWLVMQAEPASSIAWILGHAWPLPYLNLAWKHLLTTHTHDANAGCAPDDITEDVWYHLRQSRQISEGLVQESLKALCRDVDTSHSTRKDILLMLLNTLSFSRDEVVEAIVDVPEEYGTQSLAVVTPSGARARVQVIEEMPSGLFVDNPWNVPQAFVSKRFRILFLTRALPSLGYMACRLELSSKPDRHTASLFLSPESMENEFLKCIIQPDGAVELTDKKSGAVFRDLLLMEDAGEVGNAWRRQAPRNDRILYSCGCRAQIQRIMDGPLAAAVRIDVEMNIPTECPTDDSRSESLVTLRIAHILTLKQGARHLDIRTRFDNTARDHRLRVLFPTDLAGAERSFADSHFDVVERSIQLPDCDDWKEPVVGTYPMRSFAGVSDGNYGLAVITEGLHEYEVTRDDRKALAITLLRAVRIKLEVAENRKQELPDIGPQCPGFHEFRMAVFPFAGRWEESSIYCETAKFLTPILAAQFGKNKTGKAPTEASLLSCSNRNIVVSAIKKADREEALVVRIFNPTNKQQEGYLQISRPVRNACFCNLNEERGEPVPADQGGSLTITISPKKIMTLMLFL